MWRSEICLQHLTNKPRLAVRPVLFGEFCLQPLHLQLECTWTIEPTICFHEPTAVAKRGYFRGNRPTRRPKGPEKYSSRPYSLSERGRRESNPQQLDSQSNALTC